MLVPVSHIGFELLRVLLPPGEILKNFFHKAYHLTSFLKHVSPLAAWAFGCYSVLITLPIIKKTNKQNYVIKAVKIVLEQFKLTK